MPTYFYVVYDCFDTSISELNSCNRDCIAHKSKTIYYLALYNTSSTYDWKQSREHSTYEKEHENKIYELKCMNNHKA